MTDHTQRRFLSKLSQYLTKECDGSISKICFDYHVICNSGRENALVNLGNPSRNETRLLGPKRAQYVHRMIRQYRTVSRILSLKARSGKNDECETESTHHVQRFLIA